MTETRLPTPYTTKLNERFDALRADGKLEDLKFWYDGKASDDATVEDLSLEVLTILDAHDSRAYVDITDKLK